MWSLVQESTNVFLLEVMTGLYSRVVYTLWFKGSEDNQLTIQQQVQVIHKVLVITSYAIVR